MSGRVTYLTAFLSVLASPCLALPETPEGQVRFFAICAGRFSALAEHQRMFDGPASEHSDARRAEFETLIAAVQPDAHGRGVRGETILSWRIAAKSAQAQLLSQAAFQQGSARAEYARRTSVRLLDECRGGLLSG